MNTSKRRRTSKTPVRRSLFGAPPILEGENRKDYGQLLEHLFCAVKPADFIEEIWVHDVADVTWELRRLRRIHAAFLNDKISRIACDQASSLAEAEAKHIKGMSEEDKAEMDCLLSDNSPLDWETRVAQNPRANKKFQELYQLAWQTRDMDQIQAKVMITHFRTIERIEQLIVIAENRFDTVIREIDRHRFMHKQLNGLKRVEDAEFTVVTPKTIGGETSNKKAA